jgi:hypothetical protein
MLQDIATSISGSAALSSFTPTYIDSIYTQKQLFQSNILLFALYFYKTN